MIENQFTHPWTEDENRLLNDVYPHLFPEEIPIFFPARTVKAVKEKAKIMKLLRQPRKVHVFRTYENDEDGGYVSGFVDGEGFFTVTVRGERKFAKTSKDFTNFNPKFGIGLRIDDRAILDWIQKYFDCGYVTENRRKKSPAAILHVTRLYDLMSKIIPHFDKYPLRAKKKKDYETWKQMIEIQARYYRCDWPESARDRLLELYRELKAGRRLVYNGIVLPTKGRAEYQS